MPYDKSTSAALVAERDRWRAAAACNIADAIEHVECCAMECHMACPSADLLDAGWSANRNGLWFCARHIDRSLSPEEHADHDRRASGRTAADIQRLADVVLDYMERNGVAPQWATETLCRMIKGGEK